MYKAQSLWRQVARRPVFQIRNIFKIEEFLTALLKLQMLTMLCQVFLFPCRGFLGQILKFYEN